MSDGLHRSTLVTDNRLFHLFLTNFNLTPTFSSQQSEVTTADVFSYKTITRHPLPLSAPANIQLSSISTQISLVISCCTPRSKDDNPKTSSKQLHSDRAKTEQKSSVSSTILSQNYKGSLQSVSWKRFRRSKIPSVIYDPAVRKST